MSARVFRVRPRVLRLRQQPSVHGAVLAGLPRGQLVARLDFTDRGPWLRVFADGPGGGAYVGYAHADYLEHWTVRETARDEPGLDLGGRAGDGAAGPGEVPAWLAPLTDNRGHLDSVRWRLTPEGLSVGDQPPETTFGAPTTVRRVWAAFQPSFVRWCRAYDVPVELAVATACTESGGDPAEVRIEPGYESDESTPHRISPGMMQTLISTAREALRDDVPAEEITREWLLEADNSIRAGVKYIAQQRTKTGFDPPKVACAYNAGGVYPNDSAANRWKMRQYPIGAGHHADRFVKWFNDCVRVFAKTEDDIHPSFTRWLAPKPAGLVGAAPSRADAADPGAFARKLVEIAERERADVDGRDENDPFMRERLAAYWSAVPKEWDGSTSLAWSAAFISYCMREAGAGPAFVYSSSHASYINDAIRRRGDAGAAFHAFRLTERPPRPGDVIARFRPTKAWLTDGRPIVTYENALVVGWYPSHTDIVTSVDGARAWATGGNLSNTVKQVSFDLRPDGLIDSSKASSQNLVFAVLRCNL